MIAIRSVGPSVREFVLKPLIDELSGDAPAIDLVHLARQTDGDTALESELLAMFDVQAAKLLARLALIDVGAQAKADIAHRLKGSALAVGAWRVAEAATATETHFTQAVAGEALSDDPLVELQAAVEAARAAIARLSP
jgi:HPt (histidine-containing phosphotransfer) domain-containing protein